MTENRHIWSADWPAQVRKRIQALGFNSITELLASMPNRTYGDIALMLGGIAPIQVVSMQFREAKLADRVRETVKDSLCRNLIEGLPHGWNIGENADTDALVAMSIWSSNTQVTGGCEYLEPILVAITKAIRGLPPPDGWIPNGPGDDIIESVFASEWPINQNKCNC